MGCRQSFACAAALGKFGASVAGRALCSTNAETALVAIGGERLGPRAVSLYDIMGDSQNLKGASAMNLTQDQMQALGRGEAVPVTIDGRPCVLVSADVFNRAQALLGDSDPKQAYAAIDEAWRENWDAPGMADYDRYEELRP
jgi:hypothetical protein